MRIARPARLFGRALALAVGVATIGGSALAQGKVVVSHDEWFTGPANFGMNEKQFVNNALGFFGLHSGSSVLLYSNDSFLTNSTFQTFLTNAGITVTTNANATSFSGYNAVLTEGNTNLSTTGSALAAYVNGGGNVFDIGGTGVGDAAAEAAYNNAFLNYFGLTMAPSYNGIDNTNVVTTGFAAQGPFGAALFTNVPSVYSNNGSDVSLSVTPTSGVTSQVFLSGDNGVFAAAQVTTTPEPSSMALLGTGLVGLIPMVRRRRR